MPLEQSDTYWSKLLSTNLSLRQKLQRKAMVSRGFGFSMFVLMLASLLSPRTTGTPASAKSLLARVGDILS